MNLHRIDVAALPGEDIAYGWRSPDGLRGNLMTGSVIARDIEITKDGTRYVTTYCIQLDDNNILFVRPRLVQRIQNIR